MKRINLDNNSELPKKEVNSQNYLQKIKLERIITSLTNKNNNREKNIKEITSGQTYKDFCLAVESVFNILKKYNIDNFNQYENLVDFINKYKITDEKSTQIDKILECSESLINTLKSDLKNSSDLSLITDYSIVNIGKNFITNNLSIQGTIIYLSKFIRNNKNKIEKYKLEIKKLNDLEKIELTSDNTETTIENDEFNFIKILGENKVIETSEN